LLLARAGLVGFGRSLFLSLSLSLSFSFSLSLPSLTFEEAEVDKKAERGVDFG
jgi:hypothetical protein